MKNRLSHLDLMRGVAALLVCAGHLRAFLFVDAARVTAWGAAGKVFYFLTGLGHQCVVVFFVLSGFFVGGGVLKSFSMRRWSWKLYAVRRLSRLWIVLVPALVLTLAWDLGGHHLFAAGYSGAYSNVYHSGPTASVPADWRWGTFLGNLAFLQTICVPIFGTNGPMWSLANEFWYYLLFPLVLGIFLFRNWPARIAAFVLALTLMGALPSGLLWGGLIWLFGAGIYLILQIQGVRIQLERRLFLPASAALAFASLLLTKVAPGLDSDWIVGLAFVPFIACLAVRECESVNYAAVASHLGETTYTLYLLHFPFLAFVFFAFFQGRKIQPDLTGALYFAGLLCLVLIYITVVWWFFERNTDRLRKWLETALGISKNAEVTELAVKPTES